MSAIFAYSDGWNVIPPKLNQRRAFPRTTPKCLFSTSSSITIATPNTSHQTFFS